MQNFKISAIIQGPEDKKAWLYTIGDLVNSLEKAEEIVEQN